MIANLNHFLPSLPLLALTLVDTMIVTARAYIVYVPLMLVTSVINLATIPMASAASSPVATSTVTKTSDAPADKSVTIMDNYGIEQLALPVSAAIELSEPMVGGQAKLVKFSSLNPSLLAFLSGKGGAPSTQRFRVVDSAGHVMPMALRQVQKRQDIVQQVPVVAVEADNPVAMEKLRQALRIQIDKSVHSDDPQQALSIELSDLPSNQLTAQANHTISTWWLANPVSPSFKPASTDLTEPTAQLTLAFSQVQQSRPVQLQLYGSDDLQSWEMIDQSVVNPFSQAANTPTADSLAKHIITLTERHSQYRYWQLVASQPLTLNAVSVKQTRVKPSYFLTRANFSQVPHDNTHWQLKLSAPMWVSGIEFFVPENQLWQIKLAKTTDDNADNHEENMTLVSGQVDSEKSGLIWSPTVLQDLTIEGQMPTDTLPVTLLTPVYELYFLAQGKAPYQLVINAPGALAQPVINLSDTQIAALGESSEANMLALTPLDNPNADTDKYRQWLLWSVLGGILAVLSWLAYRLYQQITTQPKAE